MVYDEKLADRIREMISMTHKKVTEKSMFGCLCFMVNNKVCVGVRKDRMLVKLDRTRYDEMMEMEGCGPMDFKGRPMKGLVLVDAGVLSTKKKLEYWINIALEYNKEAKSLKEKKSKEENRGNKSS
jgi:TfoX/Sxy family transcriptional regulator of competence genes